MSEKITPDSVVDRDPVPKDPAISQKPRRGAQLTQRQPPPNTDRKPAVTPSWMKEKAEPKAATGLIREEKTSDGPQSGKAVTAQQPDGGSGQVGIGRARPVLKRATPVRESEPQLKSDAADQFIIRDSGADVLDPGSLISEKSEKSKQDPRFQRRDGARQLAAPKGAWGSDIGKVLKVPMPGSQRRVLQEGRATAAQIASSKDHNEADKKRAREQGTVLSDAGDPPWTADVAMRATGAKVHLDLLSIPPANRKLSPLSADLKSANKTFWVENAGPDGTKAKSFLCKPATKAGGPATAMPSGGAFGGEVIREALSGRAAQFLFTKGLDIGMPETHVVKLGSDLIPGGDGAGDVTCSVQQFGDSVGQLGTQSRAARSQIDAKQVAGLAMFDMMTLANDRHPGNILVAADGTLIPIDHGENFSEMGNPDAVARLKVTMAGTANALLSIPSAHDPMPPEVAKSAAALLPTDYAETLRDDRKAIVAQHGDMDGMISDDAITSAMRAAEFTKLAAKVKPPMSVAAVQVALGTHAKELLDPTLEYGVFFQNAQKILATAVKQQGTIKEVCLCSNTDYELLCQEVEKLGWRAQRRGEAASGELVGDPMTIMAILSTGQRLPSFSAPKTKYPPELELPADMPSDQVPKDLKDRRRDYDREEVRKHKEKRAGALASVETARDSVEDKDAGPALLQIRKAAVDVLLPIIPVGQQRMARARRAALEMGRQPPGDVLEGYRDLSHDLTDMVLPLQRQRFTQVEQRYHFDQFCRFIPLMGTIVPGAYLECFKELGAGNVLKAEVELKKLEAFDMTDANMLDVLWKKFDKFANAAKADAQDPDLVGFLAALKGRDPVAALGSWGALFARFG